MLKDTTIAQRYYLLQAIRTNRPNAAGVSSVPYQAGTISLYAPAIKAAAQTDGTYAPFGAILDVLGSFGDGGNSSVPAAQSGIQTQVYGVINWESQHFGYENETVGEQVTYKRKFDFSFGGVIGLYPDLVLEDLSSTTATIAQPNARPMFQDAFHWTIGPNLNRPIYSHGEATAFFDFGQNYLINQVTSFKQGDDTITATPIANSIGRAAYFIEGGLQAKMTASPIWVAHDDKVSNLSPLFVITTGVRRDSRFNGSGEIASYDHPEERFFFRFLLSLTKIGSYTDQTTAPKPASVRFGVDIERPLFDQRIPTATRFFISTDLDIMKFFRPSPSPN